MIVKSGSDSVFILSFDDMGKYLPSEYDRRFERTEYAKSIPSGKYPDIWTTTKGSPGYPELHTYSLSGGYPTYSFVDAVGGVVPVVWIKNNQK